MEDDEQQKWETESLESLSPSAYDELLEKGDDGEFYATLGAKTYWFPSSPNLQTTLERMMLEMLLLLFGGLNYPSRVETRITSLLSEPDSAVLDLGCGSNAFWLSSVAVRFPHTTAIGLDLIPPRPELLSPPNCSFEAHDLNSGIPFPDSSFSLIRHCHISSWFGKPYEFFLEEIARSLVSKGVYALFEPEPLLTIYTEDGSPLADRFPATATFQHAHHRLSSLRGFVDPVAVASEGFSSAVRNSGLFHDVQEVVHLLPIGRRTGQGPAASEISTNLLEQFFIKHRPWMLTLCGFPLITAEEISEQSRLELESLRECEEGKGVSVKAFCLTAVRV